MLVLNSLMANVHIGQFKLVSCDDLQLLHVFRSFQISSCIPIRACLSNQFSELLQIDLTYFEINTNYVIWNLACYY